MKATVIYQSDHDGSETIAVNGHHIQCGGPNGDGYCYAHGSFDCVENLSPEEQHAMEHAQWDVLIVEDERPV